MKDILETVLFGIQLSLSFILKSKTRPKRIKKKKQKNPTSIFPTLFSVKESGLYNM